MGVDAAHAWYHAPPRPTGERRTITLRVGLRPADLVDAPTTIDAYAALIIRDGTKLHIIPLLGAARGTKDDAAKARRSSRSAVAAELRGHHAAFARLARAQSAIYRRRVMPHLFVDLSKLPTGLYAVFPREAVFLGASRALARATDRIASALGAFSTTTTGRSRLLSEIERVVRDLDVSALRLSDAPLFPGKRPGRRTPAPIVAGIANDLLGATAAFADSLGTKPAQGDLTSVMTLNTANGTLSTRLFDGRLGLSRQVTSAFDVFGPGGPGTGLGAGTGSGRKNGGLSGVLGSLGGAFGTGRGVGVVGDGGDADDFGRGSGSGWTGGLGGILESLGVGVLGGGKGQTGMDTDGSSGGDGAVGGDSSMFESGEGGGGGGESGGGEIEVVSGAYWDEDAGVLVLGASSPQERENRLNSGGDSVVGINDDGEVVEVIVGGDPDGDDGSDDDGEGDDGEGDDGEGDDGEGDDGEGDDGEGDDGEGSGGPGGSGGVASTPDGEGEGNGGGRGGSSGRGRGTVPLSWGVITRGGGYTDPVDDGGTGGEGGGESGDGPVTPGGGVVDPPDGEGKGGGFGFWGGYNPPIGGETDPLVNPVPDGYAADSMGPPVARTVANHGGVHMESYSGTSGNGHPVTGLVSAGYVEEGGGQPNEGGGSGSPQREG